VFGLSELGFAKNYIRLKERATKASESTTLAAYRRFLWRNAGVPGDHRLADPHAPHVLFVVKDVSKSAHPSRITNLDELIAGVRTRHPEVTIRTVKWTEITAKAQAHALYRADIVVCPPGSDLMKTIMMRR
jgi:hypothetical protein